ncbi:DUF4381 domain-containing protein [Winogradskyella aurantiaca]|uniref:DUF4381 domain-containing protein n=1 Tax=Winogradskyella aurantiaca TaxID=2219558 RepID=UPI000E1C5B80|nr:DUF4381 domain-containing protein [Winogradskyella aurantiaca]
MIIQDQDINNVIEPTSVSYWPLQPGWYILIAIVIIVLILVAWNRYKKWLKNAYKRDAIKTINSLPNDANFFFQLNSIIKAVAIESYGRNSVASLTGKEWTSFLAKPENCRDLNSKVLKSLESQQYQKHDSPIDDLIITATKFESINWIKKHK